MSDQPEKKPRKKHKSHSHARSPNYFYLDGKLHKVVRVTRATDLVECLLISERKKVLYSWSWFKKARRPAWERGAVVKLLSRSPERICRDMAAGYIPRPERTYNPITGRQSHHMWSETDILNYHEYLINKKGRGRPRKDGAHTPPTYMCSRQELIAQMRVESSIYVKNAAGEFVPVWKSGEF